MAAPLSFRMVKTGCFVSPDFSGFASMFYTIALIFRSGHSSMYLYLLYRLPANILESASAQKFNIA